MQVQGLRGSRDGRWHHGVSHEDAAESLQPLEGQAIDFSLADDMYMYVISLFLFLLVLVHNFYSSGTSLQAATLALARATEMQLGRSHISCTFSTTPSTCPSWALFRPPW